MHTTQSMFRRFAFVFAAVAVMFLSGCATSQQAYMADSSPAHSIECNGVFGSWDACRAEAAADCGDTGYQVISRNHEDGLSEAEAEKRGAGAAFHQRQMLVQCGMGNTARFATLGSKAANSAEL